MTDVLEFSDITAEIKGALCPGRLKLTDQNIIFKNSKTGKVEQINSTDLEFSNWQKLVGNWALRLFLKNGSLHRFCGFKENELEKVEKYFKTNYSSKLEEKELSLKGWNWGTAKFNGSVLSFDINSLPAFEVPLSYVSQCTTGKNEVAVEFHQNDEAPVSLMEMRFHIPMSELAGDDPVEAFHSRVMEKASVISNPGDAIAIFREIHCLTPRGRYDIKIFQSFFQLHGKTFDYKIPKETIIRLFVLPHKDGRQNFLVVSLDPPIKQGQTRYHYLVFLFGQDDDISVELPFSEEELKEKYEGKLSKELSGPTYDVISRIMKALVNRKITVPGNFRGHSGTPAIGCSYKAAAGYLYPLERGFIYIHKPPLHIRFEEITSVNFARSGGSTRSFDCEIELKSGVVHTFSSIEKEEYTKLFDFITSKKLRVKNTKSDKTNYSAIGEDFGDSDVEGEPDAYLARVKREGKEREEDDGGEDSDDESEDEDFDPDAYEAQKKANQSHSSSSSGEEEDSGSGAGVSDEENKDKKKKKEKKEKKVKKDSASEKPRKQRRKKERDENRPKRAPSAYMLWFNETRENIKGECGPGAGITDIAKKAGELWKTLQDKTEWEKKAGKLKEEYQVAMAEYKASGGGAKPSSSGGGGEGSSTKKKSSSKKPVVATVSPTKAGAGSGFKSKEFIEDSDSTSDEDKKKKGGKKANQGGGSGDSDKESKPKEKKKQEKKKKEDSDSDKADSENEGSDEDEEEEEEAKSSDKEQKSSDKEEKKPKKKDSGSESEEILSTPTASSGSESD